MTPPIDILAIATQRHHEALEGYQALVRVEWSWANGAALVEAARTADDLEAVHRLIREMEACGE